MNDTTILSLKNQIYRLKRTIRKYRKGQILLNNKKRFLFSNYKPKSRNTKSNQPFSKADLIFHDIVKAKTKNVNKRVFLIQTKLFALGIFERSPDTYKYIRNVFPLPSETILNKTFRSTINNKIKQITSLNFLSNLIQSKQQEFTTMQQTNTSFISNSCQQVNSNVNKQSPFSEQFVPDCNQPTPFSEQFAPDCDQPHPSNEQFVPDCNQPTPFSEQFVPDCNQPTPFSEQFVPDCNQPHIFSEQFVPDCNQPTPFGQ